MVKTQLRALRQRLKTIVNPPYLNLIEVGAAGKLQAPWKQARQEINYWLRFEPRDAEEKHEKYFAIDAAIWNTEEERPFYISGGKTGFGSSLLEPNPEYVQENYEKLRLEGDAKLAETWFERSKIQAVQMVQTRTLDNILAELKQENLYHFLKVDTQGADYYIFKGAEQLLRTSCIGIQSELYHYPLYKGTVLMPDVVAYLESFGFELLKLLPAHGTFNSQQDGIFLKKGLDNKVSRKLRKMYGIE